MSSGFEIITVSQLNFYVRSQLDSDPMLRNIFVRGEISNFTNHYRSGHFYMSLKDDKAVVKAVMFKSNAQRLNFMPENGMKVIAMGRATLYDRDGQFQFYIDDMQPDGIGALHVAFEQLKAKFAQQGLFDEERKRPLPQYPERIGVITSPIGAALQDILNILSRRWPIAKVILYPVLVQGDEAPGQICKAIEYFNRHKAADVLIVGRGGGSIEELWAFNDENVARCIAASVIPVVSAVGHETDFTIADFAADLRAPTPSAAAELVSPDIINTLSHLEYLENSMKRYAQNKLENCSMRLDMAVSSPAMKEPRAAINAYRTKFEHLLMSLEASAKNRLRQESSRFATLTSKLDALSPFKVLSRGYSIASVDDKVISSVSEIHTGEDISLRLSDGTATCKVLDIVERRDSLDEE